MRIRSILLGGVCVGALAMVPGLSMAQSASDADKVDQLQRQMDALQNEIRELTQAQQQARRRHRSLAGGCCAGRAQPFLAAGVLVLESGGIQCDYRKPAGTGRSGVG